MTRKLLLTAAVALYVALSLAGMLALASLLPWTWKLFTLPAMALTGFVASDMIATIWGLNDTHHDEPNPDPFGGGPENWSLPGDPADRDDVSADWPPSDPDQLAALEAWLDLEESRLS